MITQQVFWFREIGTYQENLAKMSHKRCHTKVHKRLLVFMCHPRYDTNDVTTSSVLYRQNSNRHVPDLWSYPWHLAMLTPRHWESRVDNMTRPSIDPVTHVLTSDDIAQSTQVTGLEWPPRFLTRCTDCCWNWPQGREMIMMMVIVIIIINCQQKTETWKKHGQYWTLSSINIQPIYWVEIETYPPIKICQMNSISCLQICWFKLSKTHYKSW